MKIIGAVGLNGSGKDTLMVTIFQTIRLVPPVALTVYVSTPPAWKVANVSSLRFAVKPNVSEENSSSSVYDSTTATASISTRPPRGSAATCTVERAGGAPPSPPKKLP